MGRRPEEEVQRLIAQADGYAGAIQVDICPLCGSRRTVQGNVASCISCGGGQ